MLKSHVALVGLLVCAAVVPLAAVAQGRLPKLAQEMRIALARSGKLTTEIEQRVAKLSTWSQEEIEVQYYAEHRDIPRPSQARKHYEDEVLHKLKKLHIDRFLVHELDAKGVQVGNPFWRKL